MLFRGKLTLKSSPEQVTILVEKYNFIERSSGNH